MTLARPATTLIALAAVVTLTGCGSGSHTSPTGPTILPARTYALANFKPSAPVAAGRTTLLSFTIRTPAGTPLTAYKSCCEPHAGVDLIIVRSDDSHVQYDDTDIAANGRIDQPVVFPAPGATASSSKRTRNRPA